MLGVGFEPTKPFRAPDLQSGAFVRSAIPALKPVKTYNEPTSGFEPLTCCLQNSYSTAELRRLASTLYQKIGDPAAKSPVIFLEKFQVGELPENPRVFKTPPSH